MRALDRRAIVELGIPGAALMENAGRGAAAEIRAFLTERRRPVRGLGVVVVCGKGNNGGDGFVVARVLAGWGARVRVFLVGRAADLAGDSAAKLARLTPRLRPVEITDAGGMARLAAAFGTTGGLIVDALLGTGASGAPTGLVADAIARINESGLPAVALDLPSGVSADSGQASGAAVQATLTATFGGLKRGLLVGAGRDLAGDVRVVSIGVPAEETRRAAGVFVLEPGDVARHLPTRRPEAHKGDFGHLLVVAGSIGKTGAAALAGRAAMRAGAGLVTVASPRSQQPVVATLLTECMTEPLPETTAQTTALAAKARLLALAGRRDAVALGPGFGVDDETQGLVRELVHDLPAPMVVDADALTALAGHLGALERAAGPRCLTPHPGEMARMLGVAVEMVQADRIETARRFAAAHGAHVVLKGTLSVISAPTGPTFLNPTGNPGMASGGTGDVLTGLVGALLARGLAPLDALCCATYVHGLAGDLAARDKGQEGLIAGDVIEAIPAAILEVQRHAGPV
jgi:ADP-dependent NAD(P)H-hydrate dehydratase / NAD(P)H-hydrate epimerase